MSRNNRRYAIAANYL